MSKTTVITIILDADGAIITMPRNTRIQNFCELYCFLTNAKSQRELKCCCAAAKNFNKTQTEEELESNKKM